jgi:hypothetical protein
MKTLMPLMLTAALLWGCATSQNHAYWQARANAIASLPVEQQAAARNELLRDWYEQKEAQRQERKEYWTNVGLATAQAMQQFGAEMQANAAAQQAAALQRMHNSGSTTIITPNYIGGYNVHSIGR